MAYSRKGKTYEQIFGKEKAKIIRKKQSLVKIGKSAGMLGKHHSKATKEKISKAGLNRECSIETRRKMSAKRQNEKHPAWKGNKVGYFALHDWIKRHKPKSMFCEKCGKVTDKLDISNISGKYKRDISDFRWLCRSCHLKEDGVCPSLKALKKSYKVRMANRRVK